MRGARARRGRTLRGPFGRGKKVLGTEVDASTLGGREKTSRGRGRYQATRAAPVLGVRPAVNATGAAVDHLGHSFDASAESDDCGGGLHAAIVAIIARLFKPGCCDYRYIHNLRFSQ